MSLFQAREWWTHRVESDEEFDVGGMVLGNVDNSPSGDAKIVTGSLAGLLRIFLPRQREYKVDDLMLEKDLGSPILQLAVGRFLSSSSANALAVLHPRKLTVYTVSAEGGAGDGSGVSFYKLTRVYEHTLGVGGLHFTACNMCFGSFGGIYGKDYICVQSMDGQLSFFEADHPSFTRRLDKCLVPGPLCYVPKTDSIVTGTSEMTVEAYKYQMLAAASKAHPTDRRGSAALGGDDFKDDTSPTSTAHGAGRALKADWTINIGEHVSQIMVGRYTSGLRASQVDILVVGEHTLFCLRESGGASPIRMQKRLEYFSAAATTYARPGPAHAAAGDRMHNLIIASHTGQLMVYRDTALIWAARNTLKPVAVGVGEFGGMPGLVVAMSETGELQLSYMGTDPPVTHVSSYDTKELNYEEMDEEHRRLLTVIRDTQSDHRAEPRDMIMLRVQTPTTLDESVDGEEEAWGRAGWDGLGSRSTVAQITCRLFVSYTGADTVKDVTITVKVPDSVTAKQSAIPISSLAGGARTPLIVPLVFRARTTGMPSELSVTLAAAFTNEGGEPRITTTTFKLPMCLACRLVPPLKNSTFKFTLDTNRMPPALPALFDDMFQQPGLTEEAIQRITSSSANILSFQYFNGADATILVSKSAGRYRIQSGSLEALWLVSSELVRRLQEQFGSGSGGRGGGGKEEEEPFEILYQEPLPLADFFGCIDDHFECRQALVRASSDLNDRAHQFRLIQKRLLVRFKDRNPAPLNQLDLLMDQTHAELLELGDAVEACQQDLLQASNRLTCATHLLLMLMRYRFSMDDDNYAVLHSHFCPEVVGPDDQGWEERIDAAATHLLRTSLAKTVKEVAGVPQPLSMPPDTTKLKKHITYVCDRLSKGAVLYRPRRTKKSSGSGSGSGAGGGAGGGGAAAAAP